jgi:hypothetical protein
MHALQAEAQIGAARDHSGTRVAGIKKPAGTAKRVREFDIAALAAFL